MAGRLARTLGKSASRLALAFRIKVDPATNKVSLSFYIKRTVFARSRGRMPSDDPDDNKVLLSSFDEDHGSIATSTKEIMPAISRAFGESGCPHGYDVFLSFRGEDTRNGFVSHLHAALRHRGIATFMDSEELRKGEEIGPAILRAIGESRITIVVFSEDYASSGWCLDELERIVECRDTMRQIVLPVFYKVHPSEVRRQTGRYGQALIKHEERLKSKRGNSEKVKRWREALTQAASLSGWHLVHEREANYIDSIVKRTWAELNQDQLPVPENQAAMNSHVSHNHTLLDMESNEVCMAEICGLGGIGKVASTKATTYNAFLHKFGSFRGEATIAYAD